MAFEVSNKHFEIKDEFFPFLTATLLEDAEVFVHIHFTEFFHVYRVLRDGSEESWVAFTEEDLSKERPSLVDATDNGGKFTSIAIDEDRNRLVMSEMNVLVIEEPLLQDFLELMDRAYKEMQE